MTRMKRFRNVTSIAGQYSVVAACFAIPLSTSAMGLFAGLALIFWLLSGCVTTLPRDLIRNPVILTATALFFLLAVSTLYSSASLSTSLDALMKYRELLYLPVVFALLNQQSRYAILAKNAFIAGCIILLFISYGMYLSLIPTHKFGYSLLFHITHSFFMAILGFFALHNAFDSKRYRIVWLIVFALTAFNIIQVAPGRTGMVTFIALTFLTFVQRISSHHLVLATLATLVFFSTAFLYSDNFSSRTQIAVAEIQNYTPQKSRTSIGQRFDWWFNSLEMIKTSPLFGHGVGSFAVEQAKLIKGKRTTPTENPHNEYLLLGSQIGTVGVALYIMLLSSLLYGARNLPARQKYLLQGVVLAMAIGCLMNSFLYDSHQGHFFALLSGLFLAQTSSKVPIENTHHP